jgi:hypothetical protein
MPDDLSLQAYEALNDYFSRYEHEGVEIEILPPGFNPSDGLVMQEGRHIGIPKETLILAYVRARALLFDGIKEDFVESQVAYEASRVVLLFDPEHITAANLRKRRILRYKETGDPGKLTQAVQNEIVFLNSILTSPLHRQSKSPTLWYHRTWLLDLLLPVNPVGSPDEQVQAFIHSELDAVCKAGERHPKNYYAWLYARKLLSRYELARDGAGDQSQGNDHDDSTGHTCASTVVRWCCQHPSDTSGWSFLAFLLPRLPIVSQRLDITERVLKYAIDLQWANEALFVFLRTVIGSALLEEMQPAVFEKLVNCLGEQWPRDSKNHNVDMFQSRVEKTIKWVEVYRLSEA